MTIATILKPPEFNNGIYAAWQMREAFALGALAATAHLRDKGRRLEPETKIEVYHWFQEDKNFKKIQDETYVNTQGYLTVIPDEY